MIVLIGGGSRSGKSRYAIEYARAKGRPPRRPAWFVVPIILAIIALGVWLIPRTQPGVPRWVAWTVLVVVTAATVLFARRRR